MAFTVRTKTAFFLKIENTLPEVECVVLVCVQCSLVTNTGLLSLLNDQQWLQDIRAGDLHHSQLFTQPNRSRQKAAHPEPGSGVGFSF